MSPVVGDLFATGFLQMSHSRPPCWGSLLLFMGCVVFSSLESVADVKCNGCSTLGVLADALFMFLLVTCVSFLCALTV